MTNTNTLTRLEKLINEAETRKRFLDRGLEALQNTLNEATAELQKLRASTDEVDNPSADLNPTTQANES
jgi:uncharacterized membrane protein